MTGRKCVVCADGTEPYVALSNDDIIQRVADEAAFLKKQKSLAEAQMKTAAVIEKPAISSGVSVEDSGQRLAISRRHRGAERLVARFNQFERI